MSETISTIVSNLFLVFRVAVWGLAFLKIIEICMYICWVSRHGKLYRTTFEKTMVNKGGTIDPSDIKQIDDKLKVPWPMFWSLSRRFTDRGVITPATRLVAPMVRFLGVYIHRQPSLVIILAVLLMLTPVSVFIWIELLLLELLLYLELLDLILARGFLGFVDNFRQDFSTNPIEYYRRPIKFWSGRQFVGRFLFGVTGFMIASIIGFAGIYSGLHELYGSQAFSGLLPNGTAPQLQLLYFSIVTAATVGYGDISPGMGMVQFFVASECLFTMAVLVLLLFALSSSFTWDDLPYRK